MFYVIYYHLYNLKNVKNANGGVLLLLKYYCYRHISKFEWNVFILVQAILFYTGEAIEDDSDDDDSEVRIVQNMWFSTFLKTFSQISRGLFLSALSHLWQWEDEKVKTTGILG